MGKITSTSVVRDSDPEAADLGDAAKLLGPARIVLDRCAEGLPGAEVEAADMAQRIVDLIGHSSTDEPPHALVELEQLRTVADAARAEQQAWRALPLIPHGEPHDTWVRTHRELHDALDLISDPAL